jgi:RimJ/RimL family protein N-acetyltransferase
MRRLYIGDTAMLHVVELKEDWLPDFRRALLRAVQEEPTAFARTFEQEATRADPEWRRWLPSATSLTLCARGRDRIIGFAAHKREDRPKKAHNVTLTGLYVEPEHRGAGVGRRLVIECVERAFSEERTHAVRLTVTARDSAAVKLYSSLGFVAWGQEPDALLVDGTFYSNLHMRLTRAMWKSERVGVAPDEDRG